MTYSYMEKFIYGLTAETHTVPEFLATVSNMDASKEIFQQFRCS